MIRPNISNRQQPCPVCENLTGACRIFPDNTVFCHGLADLKKGEKANGYVCVKSANGHTATFKPDNSAEWSEERKRSWEARKAERQERAKEEERQREERALSPQRRHELYSQIFERLSLSTPTLEDLQRRGFSPEEVKTCGFKSVVANQKLSLPFDCRLPGIGQDGRSLAVKDDGYLCPIYDIDGNIVALQLRLNNPSDGNRYRWISTPSSATLQLYGENPLTVLRPVDKPEGIALIEGVGAKPFLASRRLNLLVIGAAGGQWTSSPKLLRQYLEQLSQELGGQKIITLYPDAGDVHNTGVTSRWCKVANLLMGWGWEVRFAWWGQSFKASRDVDELQPEQLSWIRYISISEFKALCVKWGGLENKTIYEPTPIDYDERIAKAQKRLHSLSYPIDLMCDSNKKYLPDLVERIPLKGLVCLRSPKGSGKSYQIKQIKQYCCGYWEEKIIYPSIPETPPEQLELLGTLKAIESPPEPRIERIWHPGLGMKFLSINARIALGRGQAIEWNFTWIEEADLEEPKVCTLTILENIDEIGLCWDSLGKIFGRDWSNTLVVIDEIELGLNHVTTSSTCHDKRSYILHTLQHKLKECLDNGGLVIGADADLSNTSVDYITAIVPGHPPFIVDHNFKGDPWEIDFYTGKRDVILSQIDDWLSESDCRPIAIAMDNQKEAESLSMLLIKKYPWLSQEVGGLIRIDSKITQTDFGKKFVQYPNESIVGGRDRAKKEIKALLPKVLIYTPSLGVGCSIDVKHFAHVFGLFFGNLEPSQARQMLARIRQAIPRTVWAKDRAGNSENEASSYLPEEIKRQMFNYNEGAMTTMQTALVKAKQMAEDSGIINPEDKDILPFLIQTLQDMMGADGTWNNPHLDLYCDEVARRNFSLSQFAVQLRQELIDEGHHLQDEVGESATNIGDAVTEGKKEIKRRNATATANAENISYEEALDIKRKPMRSDQEEHAMIKAFMKHDLPEVELTPEFVLKAKYKDDGRWLSQAKLFWHIYNLDACKDKDEREWKYRLNQFSQGVVFLPDVKTDTPKIEAIIKSGVLDWVKPEDLKTEYSNDSKDGQEFVRRCYSNRKLIKTALNITVQRDSEPIKLANRILARIGLEVVYTRKQKSNGNVTRYYKLSEELATDRDRKAVFDALNQRWEERKQKNAEVTDPQGTNRGQIKNDSLYINSSSVPQKQPEELGQNRVVHHTTEQWKEEEILDLALALEGCEEPETLVLLRQCQDIPIPAFKAASDLLPSRKREQIRQWVLDQNSA